MDTTTEATNLAALIAAAPGGVDQLALAYHFAGRRMVTSGGTQRQQALTIRLLDYGSTATAARRYVVEVTAAEPDRVRVATGAGSSIANAVSAIAWSHLD